MEAPRSRSLLESPTKLDRARVSTRVEGRWLLNLYPDAAEAGGCYQSAAAQGAARWGAEEDPDEPGWGSDPDRPVTEAARRARGHVRRYCAANRLNRLGTLTYGPPFCRERRLVGGHVRKFFRKLRTRTGALPYLWVPELHADGERYHVPFAVGRFVHRGWIAEAWPHGFVHIKLIGDLPVGSGALTESRIAARYLAKYVVKAIDRRDGGQHRYEVAEGFQPSQRRITAPTLEEVLGRASELMGGPPEEVWDSIESETWEGPHAVWARWGA